MVNELLGWVEQAGATAGRVYRGFQDNEPPTDRPAESEQERVLSDRDRARGDAGFFGFTQTQLVIAALAAVVLALVLKSK